MRNTDLGAMKPQLFFCLEILELRRHELHDIKRTHLSLQCLHPLDHRVNRSDCFFWRCSSQLRLLSGLVETGSDGLGLLVDIALCRLEVASDKLKRNLEKRGIEDELVVRHQLRGIPHSACSAVLALLVSASK